MMMKRILLFLVGWAIGISPLVIAHLAGWQPSPLWKELGRAAGFVGGAVAVRLAEHKGIVLTSEEMHRPLTLFQGKPYWDRKR